MNTVNLVCGEDQERAAQKALAYMVEGTPRNWRCAPCCIPYQDDGVTRRETAVAADMHALNTSHVRPYEPGELSKAYAEQFLGVGAVRADSAHSLAEDLLTRPWSKPCGLDDPNTDSRIIIYAVDLASEAESSDVRFGLEVIRQLALIRYSLTADLGIAAVSCLIKDPCVLIFALTNFPATLQGSGLCGKGIEVCAPTRPNEIAGILKQRSDAPTFIAVGKVTSHQVIPLLVSNWLSQHR